MRSKSHIHRSLIEKYHSLRLTTLDNFCNLESKARYVNPLENKLLLSLVGEALAKGYTISPADDTRTNMCGLVIYRNIEGIEIAYNPRWRRLVPGSLVGYRELLAAATTHWANRVVYPAPMVIIRP